MNKPLVVSFIVFATVFMGSTAVAGDVFDSPGPGYRQQIERAERALRAAIDASRDIKFGNPIIHVVPTSFATPTLPNLSFPATKLLEPNSPIPFPPSPSLQPFSAPIRLSIDNSVAPQTSRGEKKSQ